MFLAGPQHLRVFLQCIERCLVISVEDVRPQLIHAQHLALLALLNLLTFHLTVEFLAVQLTEHVESLHHIAHAFGCVEVDAVEE